MKKLIQVLIVCGLFVVMGGTASGEPNEKTKKLAESGDPVALYDMGEYYFPGREDCIALNKPMPEQCSKDAKSAIKWYTRGFEKGCALCAADLAVMYQKGYGIKKNQIEEKQWIERGLSICKGEDCDYFDRARLKEINKILEEKEKAAKFNKIMKEAEKYRDVVSKSENCKKTEDLSKCTTINSCLAASIIEEYKHDDRGKKFKKTIKGGFFGFFPKGSYDKALEELKASGEKDKSFKDGVKGLMMGCAFLIK